RPPLPVGPGRKWGTRRQQRAGDPAPGHQRDAVRAGKGIGARPDPRRRYRPGRVHPRPETLTIATRRGDAEDLLVRAWPAGGPPAGISRGVTKQASGVLSRLRPAQVPVTSRPAMAAVGNFARMRLRVSAAAVTSPPARSSARSSIAGLWPTISSTRTEEAVS